LTKITFSENKININKQLKDLIYKKIYFIIN